MRVSESEGRTMPHERNEERRRGIGFQEVLKSIREPFLTLVFSRNDCSQILEIFFFFFPPFFPEILAWILSVDSHVLHTEIILLILLLAFFQYFFFPLQHPLYTVIYIHFDFSFHRRNDESSNFNYRPHLVKNKRIRRIESWSNPLQKWFLGNITPTIDSFPRIVSRRAERTKQTMTNHRLNMHQRNSAWNIPELITEPVRVLQKISIDVSLLSVVR